MTSETQTTTKPRRGRPPGQTMAPAPAVVTVPTSRCPKCDSTERTPYFGCTEQEHDGVDEKGRPFTHIVRRRTRCLNCGQARIDRSHENRASG